MFQLLYGHDLCKKSGVKILKGKSEGITQRGTENVISKRKRTKRQTMVDKTLHKKIKG